MTNFDLLIDDLAREFGMPRLPIKQHKNEIYCFQFQSRISIKVYQDDSGWVYFLAEIGAMRTANEDTLRSLLTLNGFSFRKPFLTLGLSDEGVGVLHARTPLVEMNNGEMRRVFEDLLSVASTIRKTFDFE